MKIRKLILIIFLSFFSIINSQNKLRESAIENSEKMMKARSDKNANDFVEYLINFQKLDKEIIIRMWEKSMSKDSRMMTDLKLQRISEYKNTVQAYFNIKKGGKELGLIGISRNNGENWKFSQLISIFNYNQLKEIFIPELDPTFSYFDKNYKTRISIEEGKYLKEFKFETLSEKVNKISDFKGKVVILNFWSTSCGPCIKEMPRLNKLVSQMKNKNIVFLAPALQDKNLKLMKDFLKKHSFDYEVVFYNYKNVDITTIPTHIIINKDSKVIAKLVGGQKENIDKIEEILKSL
jgi:thiol-disulfide isomerase/thioredoxin